MSYAPDPGGNFASDAHRRVMGCLPNPDGDPVTFTALVAEKINRDPHALAHFTDVDEVGDVLADLEADGHAKQLKGGWKSTKQGFAVLTGPPDETHAQAAEATSLMTLDPAAILSNGDH